MAINETLKFSWGHIIAFIAIIFISYVTFMGIAYLRDGNFLEAGIGVLVIDLLLILFFIVPQILKGTDEKFSRKIIFERILFFGAPIAFCLLMQPFAHFWTVFSNRADIETSFSKSIEGAKGMFVSYEDYANKRIEEYDGKLRKAKTEAIHRNIEVEALRLQLLADNYTNLKQSAIEWINKASGATVWNVFMIGNIKTIERALDDWNESLTSFSTNRIQDEVESVIPFSSADESVVGAKQQLGGLKKKYAETSSPTALALGIGLFMYLLLLFPYVVQSRNTKSLYRLIGSSSFEGKRKSKTTTKSRATEKKVKRDFDIDVEDTPTSGSNDYESFTM